MLTVTEIANAARPLLESYGFSGATLFGSYAQGCASETSDIDMLVDVPKGTKMKQVLRFAHDLGQETCKTVDAYGTHEVLPDSQLYKNICEGGIAL